MNKLYIFFLLATLVACQQTELELALRFSANNRPELERVLEHYKDSLLKYKAAVFLIENMPGHLSFTGERFSTYQNEIARILNEQASDDTLFSVINKFQLTNDAIQEDIRIITSGILIRNIDQAFDMWHNKPWSQHLNFNEFCEYILPYKYAELQILDYWRDSLSTKFDDAVNNIPVYNDENLHSAYHAGKLINREVNDKIKVKSDGGKSKQSTFYRADLITRMPFGSCQDYVALTLATLRSHGVASTVDYIPQWGHLYGGNHNVITILNNNEKHLAAPYSYQNPGDVLFPTSIVPKVYRQVYAANAERKKYITKASYVFNALTHFHKDVTSEYTATTDFAIPVDKTNCVDDYVFIACSTLRTWNVVDFGYIKDNKAHFKNMGRNAVYLVLGYNGEDLFPVSEPFILTKEGEIKYLVPDHRSLQTTTLWRKYPRTEWLGYLEERMTGSKIQATNDNKLEQWNTLYEIRDSNYPDKIPLETNTKYRYWRFIIHDGIMSIAEFQLYNGSSEEFVFGRVIGEGEVLENDSAYNHSKAFDGDWLTYYNSPEDTLRQVWVGLDLGFPQNIKYARCVPRTDDNGIHYGDTYELAYWYHNNWNSLGRQIAKEKFLIFDSIPENALLLLKNLTQGKEERIFTLENGKQIWR